MSDTIRQTGETEMIRRLTAALPLGDSVRCGPGDDAAVVRADGETDWLLTSDSVTVGIHVTADAPPDRIGHKAVARTLSDVAAMGGEPRWALLDLVTPPDAPVEWLEAIYRGASSTAQRYGLDLVGGDTSRAHALSLHLFVVGSLPRGTAVLRSGARPGQRLYVTGVLGGSGKGRHLTFEPRLDEGRWLREGRWAAAMIDLSDGLSTDLHHLARQSGVGAVLDAAKIPLSPDAGGDLPLRRALDEGEDYELLFTVDPERAAEFDAAWRDHFSIPCTPIGLITDDEGTLLLRDAAGCETPIEPDGYDPFME
jgi:thiamine-monophosphate kinase